MSYKTYAAWVQNNTGGHLNPPGLFVIVEGKSLKDVTDIFENTYYSYDNCDCCGPRWDLAPEEIVDKGYGLMTMMDKLLRPRVLLITTPSKSDQNIPLIFIHRDDGRRQSLVWKEEKVDSA